MKIDIELQEKIGTFLENSQINIGDGILTLLSLAAIGAKSAKIDKKEFINMAKWAFDVTNYYESPSEEEKKLMN